MTQSTASLASHMSSQTRAMVVAAIAAVALLACCVVAFAQIAPGTIPKAPVKYTIVWSLTDARYPQAPTAPEYPETTNYYYQYVVPRIAPYYFTANKKFTLYIVNASDTFYRDPATGQWKLAAEPVYIEVTNSTNSTGGITFSVEVGLDKEGVHKAVYYAYWSIILVMEEYGTKWVVMNYTTAYQYALGDLLAAMSKMMEPRSEKGSGRLYVLKRQGILVDYKEAKKTNYIVPAIAPINITIRTPTNLTTPYKVNDTVVESRTCDTKHLCANTTLFTRPKDYSLTYIVVFPKGIIGVNEKNPVTEVRYVGPVNVKVKVEIVDAINNGTMQTGTKLNVTLVAKLFINDTEVGTLRTNVTTTVNVSQAYYMWVYTLKDRTSNRVIELEIPSVEPGKEYVVGKFNVSIGVQNATAAPSPFKILKAEIIRNTTTMTYSTTYYETRLYEVFIAKDVSVAAYDGANLTRMANVVWELTGLPVPGSSLYIHLPYLQWFTPAIGRAVTTTEVTGFVKPYPKIELEVKLNYEGYSVPIFEGYHNETLTNVVYEHVKKPRVPPEGKYLVYGPIAYLTALFKGIEKGVPKLQKDYGKAVNVTIIARLVFPEGTIEVYRATHVPKGIYVDGVYYNGTIPAYDWHSRSCVLAGIAAGSGFTVDGKTVYLDPVPVLGAPIVRAEIKEILDLPGNPIYHDHNVTQPYAFGGMLFKWGYVIDGKLRLYKSAPGEYGVYADIASGMWTGVLTVCNTPELKSLKYPAWLVIEWQYAPERAYYMVARLDLTDFLLEVTKAHLTEGLIYGVHVALLPVTISATTYSPEVTVDKQIAVEPNVAVDMRVELDYSDFVRGPWQLVTEGKVITVYDVEAGAYRSYITFVPEAYWPAVNLPAYAYRVIEIVNYLITPTLYGKVVYNSTKMLGNATYEIPPGGKAFSYYLIKVFYRDVQVGVAEFAAGYVAGADDLKSDIDGHGGKVPPTQVADKYLVPRLDVVAGFELKRPDYVKYFYDNATVTTLLPKLVVFPAYVATYVGKANLQLLNLCGEVLRASEGVVASIAVYRMPGEVYLGKFPIGEGLLSVKMPGTIELNETGWPVLKVEEYEYKLVLHYYGYELPAVDYETREPTLVKPKVGAITDVYFPLININVKVLSSEPVEPLVGFVVDAVSKPMPDMVMWRAITNTSGLAYLKNVPIEPYGVFILKVRTIVPADDRRWFADRPPFNATLAKYKQNYAEYAKWLGLSKEMDVYTFGTRGPLDQGLVVLKEDFAVPKMTRCGEVFPKTVEVRSLKVYVVDEANVVLTSVPIYPCASPSYCPSVYYNVTLVVADFFSPYNYSSRWYKFAEGKFYNLTDFRVIGMTWMRDVFKRLEDKFESLKKASLDMRSKAVAERNETKLVLADMYYVANETYRFLARMLADASTDSPYAVFSIPSIPRGVIVRLFMTGQRMPAKVYHVGYEVFSNVIEVPPKDKIAVIDTLGRVKLVDEYKVVVGGKEVPVEKGAIVVVSDVHPVTLKIVDKTRTYSINGTYVALTMTDALVRTFAYNAYKEWSYLTGLRGAVNYVRNLTEHVRSVYPIENATETYVAANGSRAIVVDTTDMSARISPVAVKAAYSLITYLLPNLGGFYVNSTKPTLSVVGLPMSQIKVVVVEKEKVNVTANLTIGYPIWLRDYSEITSKIYEFKAEPKYKYFEKYNLTIAEEYKKPDKILKNGTEPTSDEVRRVAVIKRDALIKYFDKVKTLNLTLVYEVGKDYIDYRLFEAYVNATKVEKLEYAKASVYVIYTYKDKTYKKLVSTEDVTDLFRRAMVRTEPMYLWINYGKVSEILPAEATVESYVIELLVRYKGELWLVEPVNKTRDVDLVLSTGFGGTVKREVANVYVNATGGTRSVTFTKIVPTAWKNYFGSPITIVAPVAPDGTARLSVPSWTITTGAWGTRIARIWILGTKETPRLGFGEIRAVYVPQFTGVLPKYEIRGYVILNYVEPAGGAREVYVGEFGHVVAEGKAPFMTAVGAGTGGTSTLMYLFDKVAPVDLMNVTRPIEATLRTVALAGAEIGLKLTWVDERGFPVKVYVKRIDVRVPASIEMYNKTTGLPIVKPETKKIELPKVENVTYVTMVPVDKEAKRIVKIGPEHLKYIYGSTYMVDAYAPVDTKRVKWCDIVTYLPYVPEYTIVVEAKYYPPKFVFYTPEGKPYVVEPEELVKYVKPMEFVNAFKATTLYAGSKLMKANATVLIPLLVAVLAGAPLYHNDSVVSFFKIPVDKDNAIWNVSGYVDMNIPSTSSDTELKAYIEKEFKVLPLQRVMDWTGRPLANMTVAVYEKKTDDLCRPIGISFTDRSGDLVQKLPLGERVVVYWYNTFVEYLRTVCRPAASRASLAGPEQMPLISIYDSAISDDVVKLGNATAMSSVRTWSYQFIVKVAGPAGEPMPGMIVVVKDSATNGLYFYAYGVTGPDGTVELRDPRSSFGLRLSQAPSATYLIEVYKPIEDKLMLVTRAYHTIERGSTEPLITKLISVAGVSPLRAVVQAIVPGEYVAQPAAGAKVTVRVEVPVYGYTTGYRGLIIPTEKPVAVAKMYEETLTAGADGVVATTPMTFERGTVTLTVNEWKGVPLGYERTFTMTAENLTASMAIAIPTYVYVIRAFSQDGVYLEDATITMSCSYAGRPVLNETAKGTLKAVIPIPKVGSLDCAVKGYARGVEAPPTKVSVMAGIEPKLTEMKYTIPISVAVPIFGTYSNLIIFLVALFIAVIVITVLLIEYTHWRRKRLAAILGPPR